MINAPWYTPEEDVIFTCYAANIESHKEKLDKFIELLRILDDPDDIEEQKIISDSLNLTITYEDIDYINERMG